MFSDIALPKNNEFEFIEIASKLGIKKLFFLYDFNEYDEKKLIKKLDSLNNKKISIEFGFIVNEKNFKKAAAKSKFLAAKSSDKDRIFIESKKIKLIYGFEDANKKDYIHQRASGLNQVLCEIARQNNVTVGFSYSSLLNKPNQITSLLMGRMMQNIILCRKYKVNTIIASFSDEPFGLRAHHDIASMFNLFGMNDKNIRNSLDYNF